MVQQTSRVEITEILSRRFLLFGGADRKERGGMGDSLADGATLLELAEAAHAKWDQEFEIDGGQERVRLQWAHVWDVVADEITEIPPGKHGREILIEQLQKEAAPPRERSQERTG